MKVEDYSFKEIYYITYWMHEVIGMDHALWLSDLADMARADHAPDFVIAEVKPLIYRYLDWFVKNNAPTVRVYPSGYESSEYEAGEGHEETWHQIFREEALEGADPEEVEFAFGNP